MEFICTLEQMNDELASFLPCPRRGVDPMGVVLSVGAEENRINDMEIGWVPTRFGHGPDYRCTWM